MPEPSGAASRKNNLVRLVVSSWFSVSICNVDRRFTEGGKEKKTLTNLHVIRSEAGDVSTDDVEENGLF